MTGVDPETGKAIFGLAMLIARRHLWKQRSKDRKLKAGIAAKAQTGDCVSKDIKPSNKLEVRDLVIKCIQELPPFEQALAKIWAVNPDASESELESEMLSSGLSEEVVNRYKIRKGMKLIQKSLMKLLES